MVEELRIWLRLLYFGPDSIARHFRKGLLVFDVLLLVYFVVVSFQQVGPSQKLVDATIAVILCLDWLARLWVYDGKRRFFENVTTWTDLVVIVSLAVPLLADNFLFLRVLRSLRLFHSFHVLRDLRTEHAIFARNEEIIDATLNLVIFVFVMSAIVYVLQGHMNPDIANYVDALYFTVSTLTTTGFGDIVMRDTGGRLLAVAIMIVGFALFLRLVQSIFRPSTLKHVCPDCGLSRHDFDAIHCKHCGRVIKIETEGATT